MIWRAEVEAAVQDRPPLQADTAVGIRLDSSIDLDHRQQGDHTFRAGDGAVHNDAGVALENLLAARGNVQFPIDHQHRLLRRCLARLELHLPVDRGDLGVRLQLQDVGRGQLHRILIQQGPCLPADQQQGRVNLNALIGGQGALLYLPCVADSGVNR